MMKWKWNNIKRNFAMKPWTDFLSLFKSDPKKKPAPPISSTSHSFWDATNLKNSLTTKADKCWQNYTEAAEKCNEPSGPGGPRCF